MEGGQTVNSALYQCDACHKVSVIHRPDVFLCWACMGDKGAVVEEARATIETFTVVHVAPPAFQEDAPYSVATALLEDGTRTVGRMEHGVTPHSGQIVWMMPDEHYGIIYRHKKPAM